MSQWLDAYVFGCQRCGKDHPGMTFWPLTNPADDWKWWGFCPETNEPVLLKTVTPASAEKCKRCGGSGSIIGQDRGISAMNGYSPLTTYYLTCPGCGGNGTVFQKEK